MTPISDADLARLRDERNAALEAQSLAMLEAQALREERDRLVEENRRMREALTVCASGLAECYCANPDEHKPPCGYCLARAALSGEHKETT